MHDSDLNRRELLKLAGLAAGGAVSLHPDAFGKNQDPSAKGSGAQDGEGRGKAQSVVSRILHPKLLPCIPRNMDAGASRKFRPLYDSPISTL